MMERVVIFALMVASTLSISAQGTVEDYKRAFSIGSKYNMQMVTGTADNARWTASNVFAFSLRTADGLKEREGRIAEDGTVTIGEPQREERHEGQGPAGFGGQRREGGQRMQMRGFQGGGQQRQATPTTKEGPQKLENHWMNVSDEKGGWPAMSPDSQHVAYIRDYNVWVSDVDGKNAKPISFDGTIDRYYSAYVQWSPDSRYVATCKIHVPEKRYVYYVESSPSTQLQPILHQQEYAKPGDEVKWRYPSVFEVATQKAIIPTSELFPNAYSLEDLNWNDDSKAITFEYNERGHKHYRLLEFNVETQQVRTLIEEKAETFVNYNRLWHQRLADGHQMLWQSERDNWAHLYLYDLDKAKVIRQVTKGEWVVRQVLKVDEEQGVIYFTASGMDKDEDPYHIHYYKIGLDGKNLVSLTPGNGNHSARFNDNYTWLIDTYSRQDMAPVCVVRPVENPEKGTEIGRGDVSQLVEKGWQMPEVFSAPGRDGKTMMWGIIQRPTNFDPNKKYPVIEYIYAGPGDAYVPKNFQVTNYYTNALSELGFIVVQLDGMGTSYRGKAFEEICYKNLKDAGFPDRKAWIRAAAQKYPYMDAENVGIYGCSAGGQESTTAVLLHGDFYKAAYSACGCHDNRMDKIWWNEQWMGYPVDSSYVECSNVYNAPKLERPLMLVVGELDDNVDPASTMQVANALIKAGKDFELVVIPGAHHTVGEAFGEHKRFDFFVKNLLGVNPPKWNEVK